MGLLENIKEEIFSDGHIFLSTANKKALTNAGICSILFISIIVIIIKYNLPSERKNFLL